MVFLGDKITMKDKVDIHKWGDIAEAKSFVVIKLAVNRLLDGFFHFKKRKGEIVAGAATFFSLLSFGPILLWMISLAGFLFETNLQAKDFVLSIVSDNFPHLAPWILKSISQIVSTQLSGDSGFSFINFIVLTYASLGVVTSLYFGLNTISKSESKGGFFIEDIRSLGTGLSLAVFMGGFLLLSHKNLMKSWLYSSSATLNDFTDFVLSYNLLPAIISLGFFTLYYQWSTPRNISFRDSFIGALSFVACFAVGKSCYWIYHLYTKDTMSASYGNFYTLVVAVLWVYFLMSAFFFGASVACVRSDELYKKRRVPKKPSIAEIKVAEVPEPPGEDAA